MTKQLGMIYYSYIDKFGKNRGRGVPFHFPMTIEESVTKEALHLVKDQTLMQRRIALFKVGIVQMEKDIAENAK